MDPRPDPATVTLGRWLVPDADDSPADDAALPEDAAAATPLVRRAVHAAEAFHRTAALTWPDLLTYVEAAADWRVPRQVTSPARRVVWCLIDVDVLAPLWLGSHEGTVVCAGELWHVTDTPALAWELLAGTVVGDGLWAPPATTWLHRALDELRWQLLAHVAHAGQPVGLDGIVQRLLAEARPVTPAGESPARRADLRRHVELAAADLHELGAVIWQPHRRGAGVLLPTTLGQRAWRRFDPRVLA